MGHHHNPDQKSTRPPPSAEDLQRVRREAVGLLIDRWSARHEITWLLDEIERLRRRTAYLEARLSDSSPGAITVDPEPPKAD